MSDFAANSTEAAEAVFDRVEHSEIESLGLKGFQSKWYARMRAEERCRERAALVSKQLASPKHSDEANALQSFRLAAEEMIESVPTEMRQSAVYWLINSIATRETAERVEHLKLAKREADQQLAQAEAKLKQMAREIATLVKSRHSAQ